MYFPENSRQSEIFADVLDSFSQQIPRIYFLEKIPDSNFLFQKILDGNRLFLKIPLLPELKIFYENAFNYFSLKNLDNYFYLKIPDSFYKFTMPREYFGIIPEYWREYLNQLQNLQNVCK